ncbi:hypothetical protein [Telmatospirillum sp. J64-1]|uniref:hypothetical protein n=1 Tax=Telmatospirillum sp. J64-1 TaxID=2502183 RepID=UPI00115E3767|nr:hypothetical protein [Telmatospirillum sp. J64-1]
MARSQSLSGGDKARLLRAFAFHIHRKEPAEDVLRTHIEEQLRAGRRREYLPVEAALNESGFAAALKAMTVIGEETAVILAAVVDAKDHRLLAACLNDLADFVEGM